MAISRTFFCTLIVCLTALISSSLLAQQPQEVSVDGLIYDLKHPEHSYGKAAIVGEAGEREHAAAILHPRLGKPLRAAVEEGKAIIPSAIKIGGLDTAIDVPLHYKNDEWSFNHFDAMEVSVPDAPRANEIVVVIAVSDSGRPLARVERPSMDQIMNPSG